MTMDTRKKAVFAFQLVKAVSQSITHLIQYTVSEIQFWSVKCTNATVSCIYMCIYIHICIIYILLVLLYIYLYIYMIILIIIYIHELLLLLLFIRFFLPFLFFLSSFFNQLFLFIQLSLFSSSFLFLFIGLTYCVSNAIQSSTATVLVLLFFLLGSKFFKDVMDKGKIVLETHLFCKIFCFLYRNFVSLIKSKKTSNKNQHSN